MATNMISSNGAPVVQIINDQITTTSTDLAKYFGRHHDNILRKIEDLECSAEFSALNFELAEYEDGKRESRPMYRITRDGFAILTMGFIGRKATQLKEAYIDAFNQKERQLYEQRQALTAAENPPLQETKKYQRLNDIAKSMKVQSDPVVIPSKEITELIRAVRMY